MIPREQPFAELAHLISSHSSVAFHQLSPMPPIARCTSSRVPAQNGSSIKQHHCKNTEANGIAERSLSRFRTRRLNAIVPH